MRSYVSAKNLPRRLMMASFRLMLAGTCTVTRTKVANHGAIAPSSAFQGAAGSLSERRPCCIANRPAPARFETPIFA